MSLPDVYVCITQTNILVGDNGRAAICDFGLSSILEDDTPGSPTGDSDSGYPRPSSSAGGSQHGSTVSSRGSGIMGTVRYAASELVTEDDAKATGWSDVWGFGC